MRDVVVAAFVIHTVGNLLTISGVFVPHWHPSSSIMRHARQHCHTGDGVSLMMRFSTSMAGRLAARGHTVTTHALTASCRPVPACWQLTTTHAHLQSLPVSISTRCSASAPAAEAATVPHGATLPLVLYNTLSRTKEPFTPRADQGNAVSMYVCGVTVYDLSHIGASVPYSCAPTTMHAGHARAYVTYDVLLRVLRHAGYDVTYVRNFTDIDDKIIARCGVSCCTPIATHRVHQGRRAPRGPAGPGFPLHHRVS